jgi:hypothetical protein
MFPASRRTSTSSTKIGFSADVCAKLRGSTEKRRSEMEVQRQHNEQGHEHGNGRGGRQ